MLIPIKNQVYTVEIQSVTNEGMGIAKIDGFVIFVKDAAKGDICDILVLKVNKNIAYAKIQKMITLSKDRKASECKFYERCGGCNFWHINYQAECQVKKDLIQNNLKKIGGLDIKLKEFIPSEAVKNYRNKAQFPLKLSKEGQVEIGFYKKRSHDVIDIDDCIIQDEVNKEVISFFRNYIDKEKLTIYDEMTNKGLIRHIFTRIGRKTNQLMIVIVINGYKIPDEEMLKKELLSKFGNLVSIVLNFNFDNTNVILGEKSRVLYNQEYIEDYIGDKVFKISYRSFFQVNPEQTKKLYDKALEYVSLTGNETLIDLYCGVGTISIYMADKAKKVIGVEIIEDAIKDAKENARLNNADNCEFYCGDAKDLASKLKKEGITADVILVDPPRKGLEESLINTIAEISPKRVVYISCDSATLARDLKIFCQSGFEVSKVCGVDMFPRTGHVETVVLMSRVEQ